MSASELLRIVVQADTKGAVAGFQKLGKEAEKLTDAEKRADRMAAGFRKAGGMMLIAGGAMATALYKSVDAASTLEQSIGGTEAVFGDASGAIDDYAKNASDKVGLSERAFREATTSIGGQLKRMTGDMDFARDKSIELTEVAADLAATYGGTTQEAVQALGAAFRGEADPAERFNLNLKQGAVNAKAVELGLASSTTQVSEAAKAQATYALIMEQSTDAQGQFAREADTVAGQQQRARAAFEDATAALGGALAPAMADAAGFAASLAKGFSSINDASGGMVAKLALGATGFLLLGGAVATTIGHLKALKEAMASASASSSGVVAGLAKFGPMAAGVAALTVGSLALRDSFDQNKHAIEEFVEAMSTGSDEMLLDLFAENIVANGGKVKQTFTEIAEGSFASAVAIRDSFAAAGNDTAVFDAVLTDIATTQKAVAGETDASAAAIDTYAGVAGGAAEETTTLADAIRDVESATRAAFDPLYGLQDATSKLMEAQIAAKAAADQFGAGSLEAAAANDEATRAALDYDSAMLELGASIAENPNLVAEAKASLRRWVDQGIITEEQARQTAAKFDQMAAAARNQPKNVNINVTSSGLNGVLSQLYSLDRVSRSVDGKVINIQGALSYRPPTAHAGGVVPGTGNQESLILARAGEVIYDPKGRPGASTGMDPFPSGGGGGAAIGGSDPQLFAAAVAQAMAATPLRLEVVGDGTPLAKIIRQLVRTEGGGDVQRAFGT